MSSDITKYHLGDKNVPGRDPLIKSNDGCDCPLKVNIPMRVENINISVWYFLLDFLVVKTKGCFFFFFNKNTVLHCRIKVSSLSEEKATVS